MKLSIAEKAFDISDEVFGKLHLHDLPYSRWTQESAICDQSDLKSATLVISTKKIIVKKLFPGFSQNTVSSIFTNFSSNKPLGVLSLKHKKFEILLVSKLAKMRKMN